MKKDKIIYWNFSKSYSAEFYAGGKVFYTANIKALKLFASETKTHYVVIKSQDVPNFPDYLLKNAQILYRNKKNILFKL